MLRNLHGQQNTEVAHITREPIGLSFLKCNSEGDKKGTKGEPYLNAYKVCCFQLSTYDSNKLMNFAIA